MSTRSLLVADSSKDRFSESVLACWTTPVASTHSRVTERPSHGNRPALLALRKLDVSNEANLGTPATLAIRVVQGAPLWARAASTSAERDQDAAHCQGEPSSPMGAAQPMMMSVRWLCWAYS